MSIATARRRCAAVWAQQLEERPHLGAGATAAHPQHPLAFAARPPRSRSGGPSGSRTRPSRSPSPRSDRPVPTCAADAGSRSASPSSSPVRTSGPRAAATSPCTTSPRSRPSAASPAHAAPASPDAPSRGPQRGHASRRRATRSSTACFKHRQIPDTAQVAVVHRRHRLATAASNDAWSPRRSPAPESTSTAPPRCSRRQLDNPIPRPAPELGHTIPFGHGRPRIAA